MVKSTSFTASKAVENQFRVNPQAQLRLIDALNHAYHAKVLAVHWAHQSNDRTGVDAFIEFERCQIRKVDFKFRRHNTYEQWISIETLSNVAKNQIGWAGKPSKADEIIWVRFHQNSTISDIVLCDAKQLRELVVSRADELRAVGDVKRSSSTGVHNSWQGEFVGIAPEQLRELMPSGSFKHVRLAGGSHD